jgi:hypothetical protein
VSSAILYFAIVAIWAGVLMPKWLRPSRSHRHRADGDQAAETIAEFAQPAPEAVLDERRPDRLDRPERPGRLSDEQDETPDERRLEADSPEPERVAAWSPEEAAERRASVLRARRRMLGTLVVLTAGAFAIAVTHVAAWWVIIPPGVLLGGFLLLLREAARSDAKQARRQAELAARRGGAERESPAVPAAPAAAGHDAAAEVAEAVVVETEFSAKVIDISARVTDQLYDQYTDAAERAVGD